MTQFFNRIIALAIFSTATLFGLAADAQQKVRVTIENLSPSGGVVLTPVWVGFHDGSFDSYDGGLTSQPGLERLAEDGDNSLITTDFENNLTYVSGGVSGTVASTQVGTRVQGTIGSDNGTPPPVQPGETASALFTIESGANQYFSYASMVLPSNDFFVANGNAMAHDLSSLFSGGGSVSFEIGLPGTINDAGTETEDFDSAAPPLGGLQGLFPTAGFTSPAGQMGPNEGAADPNSLIRNVAGDPFAGFANINGADLSALNFNDASLYSSGIARITITAVPEPATAMFGLLGAMGVCLVRRRS